MTHTTAQIEKVLYTAKAHTTGGREGGSSHTSDGRLEVNFSVPGTPGTGTNPEQLFAVGWSACFLSAIKLAAAKMKVRLPISPFQRLITVRKRFSSQRVSNVML